MTFLLSDTTTLQTLFTTLLSGAILIVSVVTSISSIVLSQEITDLETEQERIDAAIEFRRRTEEMADVAGSPGQPAAFLDVILCTIYHETRELQAVVSGSDNREFNRRIESLTDEILAEAKSAARTLDGAKFGTFKVLSAGLKYDYSWQLNTARRIENRYADSLTDEETRALSNLIDTLKLFATGREYFESLYYKREVSRLSSMLLYVSLPVIVFISYLLLALSTDIIPDVPVGPLSTLPLFVLFAYTVSLAPYVVLTAHVLRLAAITMQTLAAGPFIVSRGHHSDIVELEVDTDPEQWDARLDEDPDGRTGADRADVDWPGDDRTDTERVRNGPRNDGGDCVDQSGSGGNNTGVVGPDSDAEKRP
jgi:hypothetical protein